MKEKSKDFLWPPLIHDFFLSVSIPEVFGQTFGETVWGVDIQFHSCKIALDWDELLVIAKACVKEKVSWIVS